MSFSIEPIIYGLIFIGVLVLVEGLYLTVFGKSISLNSRVNRRMDLLSNRGNREQVMEQLRKEMQQHLKARKVPLYSLLSVKAQKAALAFSPRQLMMIMLVLTVVAFLALSVATAASLPVRALVAVVMGVGGVYTWVSRKAAKRTALLEEQLPDAIELMVRSLRVGHPFSSAISIVAGEMQDPLATEFGIIADESAYGRDVGEALTDMAERLDMQDMRFLAVAVTIQRQSGGNLAEILAGLSEVIRSRFRLFRRVQAITAEARWAGNFLSAFPLAAMFAIQIIQPDYYDEAQLHPFFIPACIVVAVMLVVNLIVMRALTNIKV